VTDTLQEVASLVRSKNAGPFWLTIDVFLHDTASFERVARSTLTDPATVGRLYGVDPALVRVFHLPDLRAIKISLPRPGTQGGLHDRDIHAGQQYVPLLGLPIPS
jgi:Domain of unknown function (DUF4387)